MVWGHSTLCDKKACLTWEIGSTASRSDSWERNVAMASAFFAYRLRYILVQQTNRSIEIWILLAWIAFVCSSSVFAPVLKRSMLTAVLACNGYSILSSWWAFSAEQNYNSIIYGVTSSLTLQLNTNVLDLNPIFLLSIRCEVTQQSGSVITRSSS